MIQSAPIVGMHFRPPAKAIMQVLPAGAPLRLEREPENPYDRNAIKVWIRSSTIPESQYETLDSLAAGHGIELREILAQAEWHVGYIASKTGEAAQVAREMDEDARVIATLGFDMKGGPLALFRNV